MTAKAVLAELERAGIRVRLTDQGFAFKPRLDGRLRAMVTTHAAADLLRALDPEVAWRVAAMRPQLTGAAAVPLLLARRPEGACAANACIACGDSLPEVPPLGSGRCRPCRVAVSLVATAFLRQTPVPTADARPAPLNGGRE